MFFRLQQDDSKRLTAAAPQAPLERPVIALGPAAAASPLFTPRDGGLVPI
jgi:hypothetical protein